MNSVMVLLIVVKIQQTGGGNGFYAPLEEIDTIIATADVRGIS
jgi:hypothetical protein